MNLFQFNRRLVLSGFLLLFVGAAAVFSQPPVNRTKFDFDGDGKADISVYRPSTGTFYFLLSGSGFSGGQFGIVNPGFNQVVPADYDGDGKTDVGIWYGYGNGATWDILNSANGGSRLYYPGYGIERDVPQPADYSGDGKAEFGLWRPPLDNGTGTDAQWFTKNLITTLNTAATFGQLHDKPVVGDYDGDGKADYAVYRPSNGTWYIQRTTLGAFSIPFGTAEDKPIPADYDGDGKTDIAVFRPSTGVWYLYQSQAGILGVAFGFGTDLPVAADYDGDGKADIAVYRPSNGTWYLLRSTAGFTGLVFGAAEDKPLPNAYVY